FGAGESRNRVNDGAEALLAIGDVSLLLRIPPRQPFAEVRGHDRGTCTTSGARDHRESQRDRGAVVRIARGGNRSAVRLDNIPDDRESETRSVGTGTLDKAV